MEIAANSPNMNPNETTQNKWTKAQKVKQSVIFVLDDIVNEIEPNDFQQYNGILKSSVNSPVIDKKQQKDESDMSASIRPFQTFKDDNEDNT